MPEVPDAAVDAALAAYAHALYDRPTPTHLSDKAPMRIVLEAAAPVMAEEVARRILAHMEAHGPQAGTPLGRQMRRAWRTHFRIAAQVAALTFSTPEVKRMAGEALERGDIMACPALDDQREDENRD